MVKLKEHLKKVKNNMEENKKENNILQIVVNKGTEGISFNDLKSSGAEGTENPKELGDILRSFVKKGILVEVNKKVFSVNAFEKKEGWVQSNINHLVWVEKSPSSNPYGIGMEIPKDILLVANKQKVLPGQNAQYIEIEQEGKKIAYITSSKMTYPSKYLGQVTDRGIVVLNNSVGVALNIEKNQFEGIKKEYPNGSVLEFEMGSDNSVNISKKIGNINDKGIESKICLHLYGMEEWSAPLPETEYREIQEKLNKESSSGALEIDFFTIDSASTKDIDDAIAIRRNKDGGFELFVAIANPSKYIDENGEIFYYIKKSSTTFYFRNGKISMIHPSIAEDSASLVLGERRSALVYCAKYNQEGVLQGEFFQEEAVRVKNKICYEDVDALINARDVSECVLRGSWVWDSQIEEKRDVNHIGKEQRERLKSSLENLKAWSSLVKKKSISSYYGVVPEFVMDSNGKIQTIYLNTQQELISQQIVEQCMLAANIGAARFLGKKYPILGIFRNQYEWEEGTKPKPALYEEKNEGHFGLKEKAYTHFTSPIRRSADFVVHQIMRKEITGAPTSLTPEQIETIAKRSNWNNYVAKQCKQREDRMLYGQYLEQLCQKKEVKKSFRAQECQEKGILFINEQCITLFVPTFKLPKECVQWLQKDMTENPDKVEENGWSVVTRAQRFNEAFESRIVLYSFDALSEKKDYEIFVKKKVHHLETDVFTKMVEQSAARASPKEEVFHDGQRCALFQPKRSV